MTGQKVSCFTKPLFLKAEQISRRNICNERLVCKHYNFNICVNLISF